MCACFNYLPGRGGVDEVHEQSRLVQLPPHLQQTHNTENERKIKTEQAVSQLPTANNYSSSSSGRLAQQAQPIEAQNSCNAKKRAANPL